MITKELLSASLITKPGFPVVPIVALSGGADSMLAAFRMQALHKKNPKEVAEPVYFHLDHGLRTESHLAAKELASFVSENWPGLFIGLRINVRRQVFERAKVRRHLAGRLQPLLKKNMAIADAGLCRLSQNIERTTTKKVGRDSALEERGSLWRWFYLEWIASRFSNSVIVTGHNLSDWYESYMLRLLRGAGPGGPTINRGNLYQPLAGLTKTEILKEVQDLKLPVWQDESNTERSALRNRIRLDWATEEVPNQGLAKSYSMHRASAEEKSRLLLTRLNQSSEGWPYLPNLPQVGNLSQHIDRAMKVQLKQLDTMALPKLSLKDLELKWRNPYRIGPLRCELDYVYLASLSIDEKKIWLNALLGAWGIGPLNQGAFTDVVHKLEKSKQEYTPPIQLPSLRIGFVGSDSPGYLVLRPTGFPFWGAEIEPASRNKLAYSKNARFQTNGGRKTLANICQELGVSELDRFAILLQGRDANDLDSIGLSHIRPLWQDLESS